MLPGPFWAQCYVCCCSVLATEGLSAPRRYHQDPMGVRAICGTQGAGQGGCRKVEPVPQERGHGGCRENWVWGAAGRLGGPVALGQCTPGTLRPTLTRKGAAPEAKALYPPLSN